MRVLLLAATIGGGHMRAATALKEYILQQDPSSVVKIYDTIQYVSPLLNKAVTGSYEYMAKKTPKLFGGFYKSSDKNTPINKTVEVATSGLRKRLLPLLEEFQPDIVVTTHSFATEMITALKTKEGFQVPIVSVVTDFAVHKTYINEGVDAYILSSSEMVNQMIMRGQPKEMLYPYGIPIKHEFLEKHDIEEAYQEEGLNPSLPTVLLMAGSFGVTDVLKIYHRVVKSEADFQIVLITGKNEKLYETFEKYLSKIDINNTMYEISRQYPNARQQSAKSSSLHHSRQLKPSKPTKLLYFTDEVEKYMQMSSLILTKPGGLTVTEAIATGLPMAIFKPIPGQEEQNADYLCRNGMAVRLKNDKSCTEIITDLLTHPEKLQAMREAIALKNNGNSAAKIYTLMERLIEQYRTAYPRPSAAASVSGETSLTGIKSLKEKSVSAKVPKSSKSAVKPPKDKTAAQKAAKKQALKEKALKEKANKEKERKAKALKEKADKEKERKENALKKKAKTKEKSDKSIKAKSLKTKETKEKKEKPIPTSPKSLKRDFHSDGFH